MADAKSNLEALAALRAKVSNATHSTREVLERASPHTQTAAALAVSAEKAFDIANNPIAKIVLNDKKSNQEIIDGLTTYLTAEGEDYATVTKRFAEYQAFYSYVQSSRAKLDKAHIQDLIKDLEGSTGAEIQKIVNDYAKVSQGAEKIRQLLVVMHEARLQGKTVEAIATALKENDRLVAEIEGLQANMKSLQADVESAQNRLNTQLDKKAESERGFFNSIARLFGPNSDIAAGIKVAEENLNAAKADAEATQKSLTERTSERNEKLESGPLLILRTIDATEQSFRDQIISTAKESTALLETTENALIALLTANARSRAAADEIGKKIAEAVVRETVLNGAMQQAVENTKKQAEGIKIRVDAAAAEVEAAKGDPTKEALAIAKRAEVDQIYRAANNYQQTLNQTVGDLTVSAADNADAQGRADQFQKLVQAHFRLLSQLHDQAHPTTSRALLMGLEQALAMRDGELSFAASQVMKQARAIYKDNLKEATAAQDQMHKEEIDNLEETIDALNQAQTTIIDSIQANVEHGIVREKAMKDLKDAAANLREVVRQSDEIGTMVSEKAADNVRVAEGDAGPVRPADVGAAPAAPVPPGAN